ncbi:glucan phosphorylase [Actinobacillus equuli]|nr:glucan phosphorylase [Actinobacillus equuli]
MGRTFSNAMIAEGVYELVDAALKELGQNIEEIINEEGDPGLGNGGLGRLAACYMDSLAAMKIPAIGYGIQYEYGMFRQEVRNGEQVEQPDQWLENELYGRICVQVNVSRFALADVFGKKAKNRMAAG